MKTVLFIFFFLPLFRFEVRTIVWNYLSVLFKRFKLIKIYIEWREDACLVLSDTILRKRNNAK